MAAPSRKLAEVFYDLRARTEGLDKDLAQSQRSFGKLTDFVLKNPVAAITAVGVALVGVAAKATAMAVEVERGMRRVAASTSGGTAGLKQLRADIEQLSLATGRSQAELAQAAAQAAKSAGSTAEVGERLRAALDVSQATGEDLAAVLDATDQVLDVFGKSSKEAGASLATLFSIAKGKQPISDLFASIQASAPAINKLGLDLETTGKALVALGEKGLSPNKASAELTKLAEAGAAGRVEIEALAASVTSAADPMRELAAAANEVNNSTEVVGQRIRAQFAAVMIDLGTNLATVVNPALRLFNELLSKITGNVSRGFGDRALRDFLDNAAKGSTIVRDKFGDLTTEFSRTSDATQRLATAVKEGSLSLQELGGPRLLEIIQQLQAFKSAIPETLGFDHLRKQVNDLLNAAIAARNAIEQPTTTDRGGPLPSDRLSAQAEAEKLAAKEREAALERANKALDAYQDKQRAIAEAGAEFTRLEAEGFRNLAQVVGNTVALIDAEIADVTAQIVKAGKAANFDEKTIAEGVQIATAHLVAAKKAAEAFNGAVAKIEIPPELQKKLQTLATIGKGIDELRDKLVAAGKAPEEVAKAIRDTFGDQLVAYFRSTGDSIDAAKEKADNFIGGLENVGNKALDAADSIRTIGNAVISILGAFDALDAKAAATARGLVNIGTGIATIAKGGAGSLLTGGLGLLGGVAELVKGLGAGDPEAERRHQEALRALEGIRKNTGDLLGRNVSGRSISRADSAVDFVLNQGQLNPRDPGTFLNLDDLLERAGFSFQEVEAVARAFDITLDGTIGSWLELKSVLDEIDLKALRDTFAGQLEAAQLLRRVTGNQNPLAELLDSARILAEFSPAFAGIFEGLDLEKAEDRAIALERTIGTLKAALAGDIDLDAMGISLDEFLEGLGLTSDLIRELMPEISKLKPGADAGIDALKAFQEALEQLNLAFQAIDLAQQFGGVSPEEALQQKIQSFGEAFGEAAASIDFSSMDAFKETAANLIAGFFADGELTDAEQAQITALQELLAAYSAAETGALSLANTLQNAFSDIDLDAIIFGTSQADVINSKLNEFGLQAFDLGTTAGREAAKEALRTLATGDPSLKPLIADLIRSLDQLPDIPGETAEEITQALTTGGGERSAIASDAKALTERTGNRMADYLATGLVLDRRQVQLLEQLVAGATMNPNLLVQPPAVSQFAAAMGGQTTVQGGVTVQIDALTVHVRVVSATDDPDGLGKKIGDATIRELARKVSQIIAGDTITQQRLRGKTTVS